MRQNVCAVCGNPLANVMGAQCPRCLLNLGSTLGFTDEAGACDALLDPFQVRTFGDYELLEEIARGGMGVVYRGRQLSLGREVAIKMILAGELASKGSLELFQREAQAAANLHHPNIVPVYEIGEHETQHYFTMRFVPGGKTIADWAAMKRGEFRVIATAVAQVARAVACAHSRGVLHRDLKPSNILWDDATGPQVTDFGLAKLMDSPDSTVTLNAKALGSPSYMAPEQASGRVTEITTATDVYGIGAVLYELLAGRAPFAGASLIETMRRAAEEQPEPLPQVPRDLRTICFKCLAKKPEDRYRSAASLADDLERFARGEPVSAVPLTPTQAAWRWAQRRPLIATLIALCFVSLIGGVAGIAWQWRKAEHARRGESVALRQATATVVDLYTHSGLNASKHGDATRAALWFAKSAEATAVPARRAEELTRLAAFRAESHTPVRAFESGIGPIEEIRWNRDQTALALISRRGTRSAIWELTTEKRWQPTTGATMDLATWAHATNWVTYVSGGVIHITEFPSGRSIAQTNVGEKVSCLVVSPDDGWIAVGATAPFLWNLANGQLISLPGELGAFTGLEFSRDGRFLLMTGAKARGVCAVTNPAAFLFAPVEAAGLAQAGFFGSGEKFFTTTRAGVLQVIESATGRVTETYSTPSDARRAVRAVSPDGRFLARWSDTLLERTNGAAKFPSHKNAVEAYDFSRDGQWLITGSYDTTVRRWRLADGASDAPIGWHQHGVTAVAMSPDQRFIASAQYEGAIVRVWQLGAPPPARDIPVRGATGIRLSPDGRFFTLRGWSRETAGLKSTRVHDAATAEPAGPEIKPGGEIMDAQFVGDGSVLALICVTAPENFADGATRNPGVGALQFWNWRRGERMGESVSLPAEPRGLGVHPSGVSVALYDAQGNLSEVDVETRAVRRLRSIDVSKVTPNLRGFAACRYSPDGELIIAWGLNSASIFWDRTTGQQREAELPADTKVMSVDFHGNTMALVTIQKRIDFLALSDLKRAGQSITDADWLFAGRFSPDGEQFLSGGRSSLARLWDWRRGALACPSLQHDDEVFAVSFVPETDVVTTGALDGQVRFWNRRTGLPLRPALDQGQKVLDLTMTPDGRHLIRGNYNGNTVRLYRIADLFPTMPLALTDALLLAEIDASAEIHNGALEPLSASTWLAKWQQFRAQHPAWHRWQAPKKIF